MQSSIVTWNLLAVVVAADVVRIAMFSMKVFLSLSEARKRSKEVPCKGRLESYVNKQAKPGEGLAIANSASSSMTASLIVFRRALAAEHSSRASIVRLAASFKGLFNATINASKTKVMHASAAIPYTKKGLQLHSLVTRACLKDAHTPYSAFQKQTKRTSTDAIPRMTRSAAKQGPKMTMASTGHSHKLNINKSIHTAHHRSTVALVRRPSRCNY